MQMMSGIVFTAESVFSVLWENNARVLVSAPAYNTHHFHCFQTVK